MENQKDNQNVPVPPKVFMSYCWADERKTLEFAEHLVQNGVDVILDKWDLHAGQDIHDFMEKCVKDSTINYVLVMCSPEYAARADGREGGVGKETLILSPSVYEEAGQTRVIPVIIRYDEDDNVAVPTYLKGRTYFDISTDDLYASNFDRIVMAVFGIQPYTRPKLGSPPSYIIDPTQNSQYADLVSSANRLRGADSPRAKKAAFRDFRTELSMALANIGKNSTEPSRDAIGQYIWEQWQHATVEQDMFVKALENIYRSDLNNIGEELAFFFENLHNESLEPVKRNPIAREIIKLLLWEMFILTVSFLRFQDEYEALTTLLTYRYINTSDYNQLIEESFAYMFYTYSQPVEEQYRYKFNQGGNQQLHMAAYGLCNLRCSSLAAQWVNKHGLAQADVFLYQISAAQQAATVDGLIYKGDWFPSCHLYLGNTSLGWHRLSSKSYCDKVLSLFGCHTVEQLRDVVSRCTAMAPYGFHDTPPTISAEICPERIGTEL